MRPKSEPKQVERELFQSELEQIMDLNHPLVRLGTSLDWATFESVMGATYHPTQGAPGTPTRLMVALHWLENPYWQHFSGERYFQHPVVDRCVEHDALASAGARSRSRADAARDHRGGDQDGVIGDNQISRS